MSGKIDCKICGALVHAIHPHLKTDHDGVTIEMYRESYPEAPILSERAKQKIEEIKLKKKKETVVAEAEAESGVKKKPLHEIFGLGKVKSAMSANGNPILISVFGDHENVELIPDVDENYVYDIEVLKNVMLGLELNIPIYIWGHAGTGKTALFEQVCARTNRPMIRIQHTANTEESHIVGMWTVKNNQTVFELGPLALAMKFGWVYLADEYDFAMPSISAVYQPILEGKPLVIKEADGANRIIRPNPNFRFGATGNTNGSGDEEGLYQGTVIQNSANFDRFGVVIQQRYMSKEFESRILQNQVGLRKEDADKMVDFAALVREAYDGGKISNTVSPRTLINASKIGIRRGSFRAGLHLSFINKLSKIDREVVDALSQRIFG